MIRYLDNTKWQNSCHTFYGNSLDEYFEFSDKKPEKECSYYFRVLQTDGEALLRCINVKGELPFTKKIKKSKKGDFR